MSRHTPGPWRIGGRLSYSKNAMITGQRGGNLASIIAQIYIDGKGARADEQEANARLIAAAPDLLQACLWAMEEFTEKGLAATEDDPCWYLADCIRAAIAKAEGGSPGENSC